MHTHSPTGVTVNLEGRQINVGRKSIFDREERRRSQKGRRIAVLKRYSKKKGERKEGRELQDDFDDDDHEGNRREMQV